MRHQTSAFLGALLAVAGFPALAQQLPDYPILPADVFGCTYMPGKTPADVDSADATFNRFADRAGITELNSLSLTPHWFSPDQEFEVIGMDIWDSGAAMGRGTAAIMADEDSIAEYLEALACPAHALYALIGIAPPQDDSVEGGLMEFTDCTLKANRSALDGIAAVAAINQLTAPWNLGLAYGVMFPVAGESPDATYDFKWITYYPSIQAYGSLFDQYASGAVQTAGTIIDPVMVCDNSRMYDVHQVRESTAE